jgi:hypothetical protein
MSTHEHKYITKEDIESLAEKLDAFAASLSSAERSLLGVTVYHAAKAAEQHGVKSHHFSTPFATSLGLAVKFSEHHLLVPNIPTINPGKLLAKDDGPFQEHTEKH